MDKSLARAKFVASRRDKRRFSHARRPQGESPNASQPDQGEWDGLEDLVSLEETDDREEPKSKSLGLDYGELLAQDPLLSSGQGAGWASRSLDTLEDAFADIYLSEKTTEKVSTASVFVLDLEKLAECLSQVSLEQRLFVEKGDPALHLVKPENQLVVEEGDAVCHAANRENQAVVEKDEKNEETQHEAVEIDEWLNDLLQDPEDGTSVKFEHKANEEEVQQRVRGSTEEELDSLLNMLDSVTIEEKDGTGVEVVEKHLRSEKSDGVVSQRDLDVLFWAPGSSESVTKPDAQAVASGPEDDFDAWLDTL